MDEFYKKSRGNAGLDGAQFQINLVTVFLLNALRSFKDWRISTENEAAGKFDDVVIEFSDGSAVLLQAKHKHNKRINMDQLLSNNSKNADFSLPKYFLSFQEFKPKFSVKSIIICTNADVDKEKLNHIGASHSASPDNILYYEYNDKSCTFVKFNENILSSLKINVESYYKMNMKDKRLDEQLISHENMKEFLEKLQFFDGYPSGDNLHKIINQLLSRLSYSTLWSGTSSQEINNKVEEWFKHPRGEYLTETRAVAMFCEIKSEKYCKMLKNYEVFFERNISSFTEARRLFHVTIKGLSLLHAIKVYRSLQDQEHKIIYINPDEGIQVQKKAVEAFRMSKYLYLVLIWLKVTNRREVKAITEILKEILHSNKYKKVVLVGDHSKNLAKEITTEDNILEVDESVTFQDLTEDSRDRLVEKNNISFQETAISLNELTDKLSMQDYAKAVDAEVLEKLVRGDNIKVGTKPSGLDENTAGYYIERTFEREIIVTASSNSLDGILAPSLTLDVRNMSTIGEVDNPIVKGPSLSGYTFLKDINEKQEENKNDEKRKEMITESSLFDVKEKVILISDSAGTGKTTVLAKLALDFKEKNPNMWIIRIELNNYSKFLRDSIRKKKRNIKITELLNAESTTKLTNALEKFVFSIKEKVVIMLDGFDEICPDYTKLILNLLSQCQEAENLAKIIVTTRPHMCRELETLLKVKSFVLKPFTKEHQIAFLTNYWMHNLELDNDNRNKCEKYCKILINSVSSWIKGEGNFAAIPLQVRMLAEIFEENLRWSESRDWDGCRHFLDEDYEEPILPERMKVTKLYDMFIEKKLDIFIDKANPTGTSAGNLSLNSLFHDYFINHQSLAVEIILKAEDKKFRNLFSRYRYDENVETNMLMIGIVQKVNGKLDFVHRTFAEYFVAKSIHEISELDRESINQDVNFQQFFIDEVLCNPQFTVIRAFLEAILEEYVDSLPSNIFQNYRLFTKSDPNTLKYRSSFIHLLASEGCVSILRLVLKCINFTIIRNKEITIPEQYDEIENSNTLDLLQTLVKQGGINIKDETGYIPLHYSVHRHLEMTKFLVEQGADFNAKGANDWTVLHTATEAGNLPIVKFLTERGSDINLVNKEGFTPMHSAAKEGHANIVKYLTEQGAKIDIGNNNGTTPLHLAAQRGRKEVITFLIEQGVDINVGTDDGSTPLHSAATQSNLEIVQYIMAQGADVNVRNIDGTTPTHWAARYGYFDILVFLVECISNIHIQDKNGFTILHAAAAGGHLDIVKYLIKQGMDVNFPNGVGFIPLHAAATSGHTETVAFLAQKGDVNITNADGVTAFHSAVAAGHLDTAKILVKYGADVTATFRNSVSALHVAAENGHMNVCLYLLKCGLEINVLSGEGSTVLHMAVSNGHLDMVKFLVARGVDVNVKNKEGVTAFDLAAQHGHLEIVTFLVKYTSYDEESAVQAATGGGHIGIIKFLMECIEDVAAKTDYGVIALKYASHYRHIDIVKFLVESGFDINRGDHEGFRPLHIAANRNHLDTVKYLVEQGADLDVTNNVGTTPLHLAAYNGHLDIVMYLTEHKLDVNIRNDYGYTPVMVAVIRGFLNIVERLVERGADVNVRNKEGSTALHDAAGAGFLDIMKILVAQGMDVNQANTEGFLPLHTAASKGQLDAVRFLVEHGADATLRNNFGFIPLLTAARLGHLNVVKYLSEYCDINARQEDGYTALYEAALGGDLTTVQFLAERGASLTDGHYSSSFTPLHAAAHCGYLKVVKFLVERCDLNLRTTDGNTALHEASSEGRLEIVRFLVERGADAAATNNAGLTCLQLAAANGHLDIIKFLMGHRMATPSCSTAINIG